MGDRQAELDDFGAFQQPPFDERDTYARTIVARIPTLTAKKAGMLNRAMKDYRRAREQACNYFREHDPFEFSIGDQNDLGGEIASHDEIQIPRRQVAYAIRTVRQNYREYVKDLRASPPEARRADTLAITRQGTRIFYDDGRYYLNVRTGHGDVTLPLVTSDDAYHRNRLPEPAAVPDVAPEKSYQRRPGIEVTDLSPADFPSRTQKLSTSTIQKQGERQFTANLTVQVAKRRERSFDASEARYVVGVDRGRNQLAYAALYDRQEDHVTDWWNRSGDEVTHYMDEFADRIAEFQSAGVWERMDEARDRRFRYKEQVDYEIANAIVDFARQADDSVVIALERLEGLSRLGGYSVENRRFSEWSYYRIGQVVRQKAEPYDIPVTEVDPRGTSQRCSRCAEDEATDRRGVHFVCEACDYEQHADANAAVNIAKEVGD